MQTKFFIFPTFVKKNYTSVDSYQRFEIADKNSLQEINNKLMNY